jgi:hypothetical protein
MENEATQEQLDAEETAGFEAGFAGEEVSGSPAQEGEPAETPEPNSPAEGQENTTEGEGETQPAAEPPKYTADQVREMLTEFQNNTEGRIRQLFGRMGEVNSTLQQLKQTRSAAPKMPEGGLKRLSEEFPELAKSLQGDLEEILTSMGAASAPTAPDPEALQALLTPRVDALAEEVKSRMAEGLLSVYHRDWRQVCASEGFKNWVKALPPEEAEKLGSSEDPQYVGDRITDYKSWKEEQAKRATQRQKRLESALLPTGGRRDAGAVESDEEAAFIAGFNARSG